MTKPSAIELAYAYKELEIDKTQPKYTGALDAATKPCKDGLSLTDIVAMKRGFKK